MKRFQVLSVKEAIASGCEEADLYGDDYTNLLYDFSTSPPTLIASDGMEPEDATFGRDLAWAPGLLNELADRIKALELEFLS